MRLQDNGGPVYMNGTAGANNCAPKPTPCFLHKLAQRESTGLCCAKGEHGAVLRKVLTHKKVLTLQACADPLKGGKMEQWEGGIRVNSWASGGFLPAKVRGTKYEGLACGWDWCTLPSPLPFLLALHLRTACTQPAEDLGGFAQTAPSRSWPGSTRRTGGLRQPTCRPLILTRSCRYSWAPASPHARRSPSAPSRAS